MQRESLAVRITSIARKSVTRETQRFCKVCDREGIEMTAHEVTPNLPNPIAGIGESSCHCDTIE